MGSSPTLPMPVFASVRWAPSAARLQTLDSRGERRSGAGRLAPRRRARPPHGAAERERQAAVARLGELADVRVGIPGRARGLCLRGGRGAGSRCRRIRAHGAGGARIALRHGARRSLRTRARAAHGRGRALCLRGGLRPGVRPRRARNRDLWPRGPACDRVGDLAAGRLHAASVTRAYARGAGDGERRRPHAAGPWRARRAGARRRPRRPRRAWTSASPPRPARAWSPPRCSPGCGSRAGLSGLPRAGARWPTSRPASCSSRARRPLG